MIRISRVLLIFLAILNLSCKNQHPIDENRDEKNKEAYIDLDSI